MNNGTELLISLYCLVAFTLSIVGYYQCRYKRNAFGSFWPMNVIGAFVWGDAVVFGMFWSLVSALTLYFQDVLLFLLVQSLFWVVRSLGEVIFWFNQQFSPLNNDPAKRFKKLQEVFHNNSFWFVYQIYWQCVMVLSIVASIYFGKVWLANI